MGKQRSEKNTMSTDSFDIQSQRNEWRRKGWAIPDLRGSKQEWFAVVKDLVKLVGEDKANDLDSVPQLNSSANPQTWRSYAAFLKGIGLVNNQAGLLRLSDEGIKFYNTPTEICMANHIQNKVRLFGEVLSFIESNPATVDEVDNYLCASYGLSWANLSNTRRRMDWLEVLGLIQAIGNRKWEITQAGKDALSGWCMVTPDALESVGESLEEIEIADAPAEIGVLLQQLQENPEKHQERNTYNIWAPSPNRIENLRMIIQFASEKVAKTELFKFVEEKFKLKTSSVESMLPFLKASGLLVEVERSIYLATPAAKAWLETSNDLDFIRILHANMRFVGEMIVAANDDIVRNDLYAQAKQYGLNTEKARWIAGLLIEAGLLEEPQYLHLKATAMGKQFAASLPLAPDPSELPLESVTTVEQPDNAKFPNDKLDQAINRLQVAGRDPMAEGKASGVAFEEAIAEMFCLMGFEAKRIGGAGDTDVVVHWKNTDGNTVTAVVDGKSKSGGQVSHSDISDVAIDTHKDKNGAEFVAIVGPGFSGDTIRNHARKKSFALVTDKELGEIAKTSRNLGLSLQEIALLFKTPNGLSELEELMASKQRELDLISMVITKFREEQDLLGNLSPRDLFLLLRHTNISPSLEELLYVIETLSRPEIGILQIKNSARSVENTVYGIVGEKGNVNRLRALASAIDKGLGE